MLTSIFLTPPKPASPFFKETSTILSASKVGIDTVVNRDMINPTKTKKVCNGIFMIWGFTGKAAQVGLHSPFYSVDSNRWLHSWAKPHQSTVSSRPKKYVIGKEYVSGRDVPKLVDRAVAPSTNTTAVAIPRNQNGRNTPVFREVCA